MATQEAGCKKGYIAQQIVLFSLFDSSLLHIFGNTLVSDHCLWDFKLETTRLMMLLCLLKIQLVDYVPYLHICK